MAVMLSPCYPLDMESRLYFIFFLRYSSTKSTYERGAAAHPVVIVVSPLNALIKDQIRRLQEGNVKAAILNVKKKTNSEDLESDLSDASLSQLRDAKYEVIFTHPEAFLTCKQGIELFQTAKYQTNVHAIVIDEAHCILI